MTRVSSRKPRRFKIGEQEYTIVGKEGYWRNEDTFIEMDVYEAVCAHPGCDRTFRYPGTKTNVKRRNVNRRCPQHKAPGIPVDEPKPRTKSAAAKRLRAPVAPQRTVRDRNTARPAPRATQTPPTPSYLD
jgi:hypothetical protein